MLQRPLSAPLTVPSGLSKSGADSMISFDSPVPRFRNWYVPFGFVLFIAATYIIGTVPSTILFIIAWVKGYEKMSWKTTIICVIFCLIIVIPIFTMWLGIPFPVGKIGELILGY